MGILSQYNVMGIADTLKQQTSELFNHYKSAFDSIFNLFDNAARNSIGKSGSNNQNNSSPKPMANVTVNINNPVTVNEKTIQAQVAQGVDEGMSKVADIINRTNKIDNY